MYGCNQGYRQDDIDINITNQNVNSNTNENFNASDIYLVKNTKN